MSTRRVHSVLEEVVAGVFPSAVGVLFLAEAYLCRPNRETDRAKAQHMPTKARAHNLTLYFDMLTGLLDGSGHVI